MVLEPMLALWRARKDVEGLRWWNEERVIREPYMSGALDGTSATQHALPAYPSARASEPPPTSKGHGHQKLSSLDPSELEYACDATTPILGQSAATS